MTFDKDALHSLFASPFDPGRWTDVLANLFGARGSLLASPQTLPASTAGDRGFYLGAFTTSDGLSVGLYRFDISSGTVLRRKVGLRALVKPFLAWNHHAALVVFAEKNSPIWRFSFICDLDAGATAPKRFTYVFGDPAMPYHTPVERFLALQSSRADGRPVSFTAMQEAFSVEALSKQFYGELFEWYCRAVAPESDVYFPNDPENGYDDRENIDIKIIRLVTRVLFTWFIRRKGLVPESIFDEAFLSRVLKEFNPLSKTSGCYYNAILQNLFFGTLNTPILDEETGTPMRRFAKGTEQQPGNLYRYAEMFSVPETDAVAIFERIPYMNGGLFECLDRPKGLYRDEFAKNGSREMLYDGFSRNAARDQKTGHYKRRAFIPNSLFFARDERAPGLFPILSRYNFTVEENAPDDAEVSLDPELLGKVFENLLGAYNPETSESARKSSGSFYTPREIVAYMAKEAVDSYMRGHERDAPQVRIARLKSIRILDLACGSGAFPMGCLSELVACIEEISREASLPFDRRQTKLDIIRDCLYGVDIQSIAMMITKLRFFISLVCEQEALSSDPAANYGVATLPNLETRFVATNSLLQAKIHRFHAGLFDAPLETLQKDLFCIREDYFQARTRKEKFRLRAEDKAKCAEIKAHIFSSLGQPDEDQIARWESELAQERQKLQTVAAPLWRDMTEAERAGIGVQQTLFGMDDPEPAQPSLFRIDANEQPRKAAKARISALEKNIRAEKAKANIDGFSEAVNEVTEWKPYDQVHVESFLDPEWMFGVKDGFDIVVGNPPYINFSKRKDLGAFYKPLGFNTFDSNGDIYCLFYERGWQLLKDGGHLCYITSNKWMRAGYGEATRKFFAEKTNPQLLIDFAGEKVFESATVDTNILLFEKNSVNLGKTKCCIGTSDCRKDLSVFVKRNATPCAFTSSDSWVILSPAELSIKRKIEAVGTPLKDWNIQINYGIKTGCNEAFIIDEAKRAEILSWCRNTAERKRTEQIIRPILRGRDIKRYGYDWAGLYLIASHNGIPEKGIKRIDIKDYPSIKCHLDAHWDKISSRSDKGDTPYNLRSCAYMDDFSKPKIVWMDLSDVPTFAYDCNSQFANNTVYFLSSEKDILFLLGYLNSKVATYLFSKIGSTSGVGTTRWQAFTMERLLVPSTTSADQSNIVQLVNLILEAKKTNPNADTSTLESQIDTLVYQFYNLTDDEIAVIEEQTK